MKLRVLFLASGALCLVNIAGVTYATTDHPTTPPAVETPVPSAVAPGQSVAIGGADVSASAAAAAAAGAQSLAAGGESAATTNTAIDASNRSSYRSRAILIPPVVPGTPSSQLATGDIIKETSACGPLQHIVRQPVDGTFIGLFRSVSVPQGWSDDLEPFRDPDGRLIDYRSERQADGDVRLFGHQVVMFTTVVGVASNRNVALGGGGGSGWGQGGMGSSSSNQRMVTTIQLRDCEIGTMRTVQVEVPPKTIRR